MPATASTISGRIMLVSAPWPLFNRPSLPLGALKAFLSDELPSLQVDACHLFLQYANALGYEDYQRISKRVWRAEAVFSALLYPQLSGQSESLYASTIKREDPAPADFQQVVARVEAVTAEWLGQIDWSALDLVGFSISFCQVTASLYLIERIKAIRPSLPVVVGGSSFSGHGTADLLKLLPQIDYLVIGEGERPLTNLLGLLLDPSRRLPGTTLPAGVRASHSQAEAMGRFDQMEQLEKLPVPDYDAYFSLLAQFPPSQRFFPVLPIEASRGCWWHRQETGGRFRGCAFCNLNLQWHGYRSKTADQVVRELAHQVERYQVLSVAFADNVLPAKQAAAIFDGIRERGMDLSIFAELRATPSADLIRSMHLAGVDTVQVGIETLSARLLVKMNKGVRVIDNLCMMKLCEAAGIRNESNLMLHFPGSDETDVAETLHTLAFVCWYRPLKPVSFWLGLDSPVHRHARHFNICSTYNHPNLKKLFPEPLATKLPFMIRGYRGDRGRQQQRWRPVAKAICQWRKDYDTMQRRTGGGPALSYRDAGRFLIIDQYDPQQPIAKHRLTGISAEIYRFCFVPRRLEQILAAFTSHNSQQILAFLTAMVDKRLMFEQANDYLSLASPLTWPGKP